MNDNEEARFAAVDIQVKRDEGVTIEFADGLVAEFNLMELRLACPCATCRSLRDKGEQSWPQAQSPKPLRISDAALHGGWGLNVTWNDGHSTGIFPFDALRKWADSAGPDQVKKIEIAEPTEPAEAPEPPSVI